MTSITVLSPISQQNFILLFLTLIYFPLIPSLAETQPILLLGFGFLLLFFNQVSVNNYFFALIVYSLIMSALAIFLSSYNREFISELTKINLNLLICFLIYRTVGFGSKNFYLLFIAMHLLILTLSIIAPSVLTMIFPRYVILEGGRGLSYFASEPSYAATYIFAITLPYTLGLVMKQFSSKLIFWMLNFFLLSTLSLIGFLYFLIIILIFLSSTNFTKRFFIITSSIIIGIIFATAVDRVANELVPLAQSLISRDDDILEIAISYPSASTRIILNLIAILEGLDRGLLLAVDGFNISLPDILGKYGLYDIILKHEVIGTLYLEDANLKPQAMFPYTVYVFGLFSLAFILYPLYVIALCIKRKQYLIFIPVFLMLVVFFMYQSQYANPIQYLVFIFIERFLKCRECAQ